MSYQHISIIDLMIKLNSSSDVHKLIHQVKNMWCNNGMKIDKVELIETSFICVQLTTPTNFMFLAKNF